MHRACAEFLRDQGVPMLFMLSLGLVVSLLKRRSRAKAQGASPIDPGQVEQQGVPQAPGPVQCATAPA